MAQKGDMSKIDLWIQSEKNMLKVYELLKLTELGPSEVAFAMGWKNSKAWHYIKKLFHGGYLGKEGRGIYSSNKKKQYVMKDYVSVKERLQAIAEELPNMPKQKKMLPTGTPHVVVQGNVTTYYNLSRPAGDYAWQRRKQKTVVSIGSGLGNV